MTMPAEETVHLDFRGLQCPQPIIKTAKASRVLKGRRARLIIISDDDSFPMDLQSWAKSTKAQVVTLDETSQGHLAEVIINPEATPNVVTASDLPSPVAQSQSGQAIQVSQPTAKSKTTDDILDCRGMQCPQPIIALAKKARNMAPGQTLKIMADDESFPMDLKSWLKSANYELNALNEFDGNYSAIIVKPKEEGLLSQSGVAQMSQPGLPATIQPATMQPAPQAHQHVAPQTSEANASALTIDLQGNTQEQTQQRLQAMRVLGLQAGTQVNFVAGDLDTIQVLTQWAGAQQHHIVQLDTRTKPIQVLMELGHGNDQPLELSSSTALVPVNKTKKSTLLVLHNDLEALLAALMVATASASQGMEVVMFFSFWGVNLLRGDKPNPNVPKEKVSLAQRLFKFLMPKGPRKQALGQLNFGGFGSMMLGKIMKEKNVMSLEDMLQSAVDLDVKFIVCTMSMSVMGITKRDLVVLPNMQYAGVASFVQEAADSEMSMMF